jgi:hypothetical protein
MLDGKALPSEVSYSAEHMYGVDALQRLLRSPLAGVVYVRR